jgi:hypothetical protein
MDYMADYMANTVTMSSCRGGVRGAVAERAAPRQRLSSASKTVLVEWWLRPRHVVLPARAC